MKPALYLTRPLPGGDPGPLAAAFEVRGGTAPARSGAALREAARGARTLVEAYLRLPNVVLTPHLGSGRETRAAMSRMVFDEVLRVARGERPLHPVS